MRLADLIDRLIEIQNSHECDGVLVTTMQESDASGQTVQYSSNVRDVAVSVRYRKGGTEEEKVSSIVIIGKEID